MYAISVPIFAKLTADRRRYMKGIYTEFHQKRPKNKKTR